MMAESSKPSGSQDVPANKPAVVEINENTLKNALMPDIKKVLVERINPDFGVLDKLLTSKALSRDEIAEIKNLSTCGMRNSLLLELVTRNKKLTELFNALKDAHQEHLVNYVSAKGEYSPKYGGEWPLMEREISILDANQESLTDILDFTGNEIVNKLYSLKVLNQRQKDFICTMPYDFRKAETLLDLLYRSSMSDYWKMIACLRLTNQPNVAKILHEGGAVVRLHNVVGDTEAVTTAEREIVERIDSALSSMSFEESRCLLEKLHLKVLAARTGHSVILYVLCETIDELTHLNKLLTSGELQSDIEQFFNKLISRSEKAHVLTTVSKETLNKCRMLLEVDRSQDKVCSKDVLKLCEQMEAGGQSSSGASAASKIQERLPVHESRYASQEFALEINRRLRAIGDEIPDRESVWEQLRERGRGVCLIL